MFPGGSKGGGSAPPTGTHEAHDMVMLKDPQLHQTQRVCGLWLQQRLHRVQDTSLRLWRELGFSQAENSRPPFQLGEAS